MNSHLIGRLTILRRPEQLDHPFLVRWMKDPSYLEFVNGSPIQTEKEIAINAKQIILESYEPWPHTYTLIAIQKSTLRPIGYVTFSQIDWRSRTAEYSIMVGSKRKSFYAAELSYLGLKYAFEYLNIHKINGYILKSNAAANRLAEFGAEREGCLRNHSYCNGHYQNVILYSVSREHFLNFESTHATTLLKKYAFST